MRTVTFLCASHGYAFWLYTRNKKNTPAESAFNGQWA